MWFLRNPERMKEEAAGIEVLSAETRWLVTATPRLKKGPRFEIDFDIVVNSEVLPFTLAYPSFFPETPPSVLPRDGRHYSSHQWGSGGELCLEYRTDNWDPTITGAMMIESAYRLLSGERPAPDIRSVVPSAHQASLGQQLRNENCRAFLTSGLCDHIAALQPGCRYLCHVIEMRTHRPTWTAFVASIGPTSAPTWQEQSIPLGNGQGIPGYLVRLPSLAGVSISGHEDLERIVESAFSQDATPAKDKTVSRFTVLADDTSAQFYFSFFHEGAWKVLRHRTIDISHETHTRLPDSYTCLTEKTVGIVGCGSLGSKIATTLARSGVREFVLVDDDILKPDNLMRNDLGVEGLGAHKTDGLSGRLAAVAPGVKVEVCRVALGDQESSGTTAKILDRLAGCDLLVDATADSQAFNFVSAVALRACRPLIWAEVYAGGIGGFVARLRPNIEPPPPAARRQYDAWCRSRGVTWQGQGDRYDVSCGNEPPLVADDADVGVIAAHAARMAIDVLVLGNKSNFPHPAYAIGLTKGWVFEQPFETWPIDFSAEGKWQLPLSKEQAGTAVQYLLALLDKTNDAD